MGEKVSEAWGRGLGQFVKVDRTGVNSTLQSSWGRLNAGPFFFHTSPLGACWLGRESQVTELHELGSGADMEVNGILTLGRTDRGLSLRKRREFV